MSRFQKRDVEIYERSMRGERTSALAEEYDLSDSRISQIVTEVGRNMPEVDIAHLRALSASRLEFMHEEVIRLAKMDGAPVTAGKDGDIVEDPATGEVVRDYSLRLRALAEMRAIDAQFSKRFGLDAPTQSEVKATVNYEIVGVDPEAMT